MQWTVLVMGLKNAATQFQRMMEWVLREIMNVDPYIDDVIAGSSGENLEDSLWQNYEKVWSVLKEF